MLLYMGEPTPFTHACFKKLNTPARIQDFLDSLPFNAETHGETCMSPRLVLEKRKAHCLEGALFAYAVLLFHGEKPALMNLKTARGDDDHAVTLFKRNGLYGAFSKTNHAVLRYRDPIYKTPRELALSYVHEYFMYKTGKKTLRSYSKPLSLRAVGQDWIESKKPLWSIADALASSPHVPLFPKSQERYLKDASLFERRVLDTREWK